jgi:hypothetical protein
VAEKRATLINPFFRNHKSESKIAILKSESKNSKKKSEIQHFGNVHLQPSNVFAEF